MDDTKPKKRYQKRKRKEIKPLPPESKKSPHSIRELLNHIRETATPGHIESHIAYAERLNLAWKGPRYGIESINTSIFDTTEDGDNNLPYWTIEAYAREVGVPSSLILLVSRVLSELNKSKPERALLILAGMEASIEALRQGVDGKTVDVRKVFDAYLAMCPRAD